MTNQTDTLSLSRESKTSMIYPRDVKGMEKIKTCTELRLMTVEHVLRNLEREEDDAKRAGHLGNPIPKGLECKKQLAQRFMKNAQEELEKIRLELEMMHLQMRNNDISKDTFTL